MKPRDERSSVHETLKHQENSLKTACSLKSLSEIITPVLFHDGLSNLKNSTILDIVVSFVSNTVRNIDTISLLPLLLMTSIKFT